jgi:multidrug efflux system membrane fusion protein
MNRTDLPDPDTNRSQARPARSRGRWWAAVLVAGVALAGVGAWWISDATPRAPSAGTKKGPGGDAAARPVSVMVQPATLQPLALTLTALGTATARNTVTVRVRVDGELTQVAFTEGQLVKAGDLLALIDPRPFQVQLDSAKAQLERDQAQLQNAHLDLERYRGLTADDSIPKQQFDTQEALVRQLQGTVDADKAQVASAQLQLSYTRVTAPVGGRVGLRQVDAGNIVHAADAGGLVVITEVQPIAVIFPIPQDSLPGVLGRLRAGARLAVDAFDRDGQTLLGTGRLLTVDNLIDTTTGTVKLKAEFPNRDGTLFPNQFVNVRLHLDTLPHALTIPSAAVQRGAPGLYAYVIGSGDTVQMRPLKLGATDGDRIEVLTGVSVGEQVVVDGADKLRDGAKVEVIDPSRPAARGAADAARPNARPGAAKVATDAPKGTTAVDPKAK